jgi:hypothetical protein
MPTIGHPRNTIMIPKKKNDEPLIFVRWKKKKIVFFIPIMKARPARNNN